MSRIFQALRRLEKPNGKGRPDPAANHRELWPDLAGSRNSRGATDSRSKPGASDRPKPDCLRVLAQLDHAQEKGGLKTVVEPGEQWRDLSSRISLDPEIIEHAEQVACQPQAEERVLISGQFPVSAQESFRVLCQRLLQVREQRRLRTVLITSPVPREGKTVVAINLAATLARNSPSVLLVDADLRHPQSSALGIAPGSGLADYLLAGEIELMKSIRRVDRLGFYYLGAGLAPTNPAELLQHPALQDFISQAAGAFEWVIFDSPSINLFADPRHLGRLVDGVLLVVRENVTPIEAAEKSLAALDKCFVIGAVFNASTGSLYSHYELSETSHPVSGADAPVGARPLEEKLLGNSSLMPCERPDQGRPQL